MYSKTYEHIILFILLKYTVYLNYTCTIAVDTHTLKNDGGMVLSLLFRGRIALDNLDIENIEDGTKDYHSHGVTVYHGWKVCMYYLKHCHQFV